MGGEARLAVRALVRGSGERPRLDVDLAFGSGVTAVMGPSGAGKSTLLSAIAGLVVPDSGRIVLDGAVLFEAGSDAAGRAVVPAHRRRVALVFQSLALFPHLSAWENVAYGLPERARAERRERAHEWLARTHVAHLADRYPASISGGEAQRVALARALASEPRAVLLDEPFSALDTALRQTLGSELVSLVAELDIPALLVTHHAEDATRLGARVVELVGGRVVGEGRR
jgi:molybdate transport system ATP-binding protein